MTRATGKGTKFGIALLAASGLAGPSLIGVASAQPAPGTGTRVDTPAASPTVAPAPQPAAPTPAPAAAPAPPPATEQPLPASSSPAPAPPTATAQTPAAAAPAPPAPPAKQNDYDGPPLLFGGPQKKPTLGGYGGLTIAYSRMLRRDGVLIGGEGGLLVDHRLTLGGAGYVFSRTPSGPPTSGGVEREFFVGYGGGLVRYAIYSDIPVYVSFGVLIGGGALTLAPRYPEGDHDDVHDDDVEVRGFFVTQPDISLHVNATRWLRFSLTGGYRIATAIDDFGYDWDEVGGAVVGGNIQGGWF